MDFGVIIALRDSKLAYATECFSYLELNAVFLHNFWRPQPTLPCFRLQYSIKNSKKQEDQDNGFTFFNAGGLRFVNRHGGTIRRAGWFAFTKTYSQGKFVKFFFYLLLRFAACSSLLLHFHHILQRALGRPNLDGSV